MLLSKIVAFIMTSKQTRLVRHTFSLNDFVFLEFFGAVFIGVSLLFVNIQNIDPSWIRSQGEVVDIVETYGSRRSGPIYYPVFKYSVNGQIYQFTRGWGSSAYPAIGSKAEIAYNPNQPGQANAVQSIGGWIGLSLFLIVGIIVVILAPVLFIKSLKRSRVIKNLIQIGQKIEGTVVRLKSVGGPKRTRNYRNYKIIVLATNNAGITKEYISDRVGSYTDLASVDFHKNPIPVGVYIHPVNSEQYYVDIEGMSDLTSLIRDPFYS